MSDKPTEEEILRAVNRACAAFDDLVATKVITGLFFDNPVVSRDQRVVEVIDAMNALSSVAELAKDA
jgi:hypothetical protein